MVRAGTNKRKRKHKKKKGGECIFDPQLGAIILDRDLATGRKGWEILETKDAITRIDEEIRNKWGDKAAIVSLYDLDEKLVCFVIAMNKSFATEIVVRLFGQNPPPFTSKDESRIYM